MQEIMRYAAALEGEAGKSLPPVHLWNPDYCGELDLVIRRDGTWIYEGGPIGRARLVRLFSTVLKREGERYFLVTPVEKLGVRVEDAPFVAVLMRVEAGAGGPRERRLVFTTNVGDEVAAGPGHALVFRRDGRGEGGGGESGGGEKGPDDAADARAPYLHVRAGLEARIARAVYYDLVALGETHHIDGGEHFGVWSGGVFFPFGPADEILG